MSSETQVCQCPFLVFSLALEVPDSQTKPEGVQLSGLADPCRQDKGPTVFERFLFLELQEEQVAFDTPFQRRLHSLAEC